VRWKQENHCFKASLCYTIRPCLKNNKTNKACPKPKTKTNKNNNKKKTIPNPSTPIKYSAGDVYSFTFVLGPGMWLLNMVLHCFIVS
jgi:hypothetical protein